MVTHSNLDTFNLVTGLDITNLLVIKKKKKSGLTY